MEASCIPCLRTNEVARGEVAAEEDDRLAAEQPVLGAAEGQHVDAAVGGDLAEAGPQARRGVGEPGAVDVQQQTGGVRGLGQRGRLGRRVHGAELGRLRDRDDPRLHVVLVADADDGAAHQLRRQLAVGGRQIDELAAGEALRRAALVHVDVRGLGADDGLERTASPWPAP